MGLSVPSNTVGHGCRLRRKACVAMNVHRTRGRALAGARSWRIPARQPTAFLLLTIPLQCQLTVHLVSWKWLRRHDFRRSSAPAAYCRGRRATLTSLLLAQLRVPLLALRSPQPPAARPAPGETPQFRQESPNRRSAGPLAESTRRSKYLRNRLSCNVLGKSWHHPVDIARRARIRGRTGFRIVQVQRELQVISEVRVRSA